MVCSNNSVADGCGGKLSGRRTRAFVALLGLLLAFSWWCGWSSRPASSSVMNWPPELAYAATATGDYSFFPYRRDVWIVCHSKGTAQFFHSPESTTSEQPPVKSRVYTIDRTLFPQDQVQFLISERNLTNYLWIVNPTTGNGRFIRARRDGGFDESPIIESAKEL
ncbi:MAG: hypothetical protein ACKVX7_02410 [Planctomycetota bacterium]